MRINKFKKNNKIKIYKSCNEIRKENYSSEDNSNINNIIKRKKLNFNLSEESIDIESDEKKNYFNNTSIDNEINENIIYKKKYFELKKNIIMNVNKILNFCNENYDHTNTEENYQFDDSKISYENTLKDESCLKKISNLNLNDNNFFINARCINKSALRKNEDDNGFRFFVDLKDESGSIRLLGFNKNDDKFHYLFECNHIFKVSNASVKLINSRFNSIGGRYELRFNNKTNVEKIKIENFNIKYDHCKKEDLKITMISDLINKKKNDKVNIFALIMKVGELRHVKSPFKNELSPLRLISLVDASSKCINCSLWNHMVTKKFNFFKILNIFFFKAHEINTDNQGQIVLIKNSKVTDFDGKSLTSNYESTFNFNFDNYDNLNATKIKLRKWLKINNEDFSEIQNLSNTDNF